MRISGIAVVSSIAIPEPVSLSSFQFQVSHNTSQESGEARRYTYYVITVLIISRCKNNKSLRTVITFIDARHDSVINSRKLRRHAIIAMAFPQVTLMSNVSAASRCSPL